MPDTRKLQCSATIGPQGELLLAEDIRRQLSTYRRVELTIHLRREDSALSERGIDAAAVAARQKLPPDVVEFVLAGEGAAGNSTLLCGKIRALL